MSPASATPHPELADDFELDREIAFLNSGSQSICPARVFGELIRRAREYERNPTSVLWGQWESLWVAQCRVAKHLGARPEDLFFRNTVTDALNSFLLGVPLPTDPGGELLIGDLEYGAVANIARFRAESSGLALRTFPLPVGETELRDLTPARLAELVVAQLRPETRLLLLSHVVTSTGLRLPIAEIARETRRRGVVFAVDGAHGPGAVALDFATLADLDFYGGNLHKWMMGPKGTAFGWVAPRRQATLDPRQAGWTTYELGPGYAGFGGGSRFAERMMLSASQDFSGFHALRTLIDWWEERGPARIRERLYALQAYAEDAIDRRLGWPKLSPPAGPLRGPLLTYALPPGLDAPGTGLMRRLLDEHRVQLVTLAVRDRAVLRISPNIYNREDEIDRGVAALEAVARAHARG